MKRKRETALCVFQHLRSRNIIDFQLKSHQVHSSSIIKFVLEKISYSPPWLVLVCVGSSCHGGPVTWPKGPKGAAGCVAAWVWCQRECWPGILEPRRIKAIGEGVRSDGFNIFQSKSCQIHFFQVIELMFYSFSIHESQWWLIEEWLKLLPIRRYWVDCSLIFIDHYCINLFSISFRLGRHQSSLLAAIQGRGRARQTNQRMHLSPAKRGVWIEKTDMVRLKPWCYPCYPLDLHC